MKRYDMIMKKEMNTFKIYKDEVMTVMGGIFRKAILNKIMKALILLLAAVMIMCIGVSGDADAYSPGDVIYINATASNYAPGSGTNFTVTVTLTDFAGNGVTGKAGDGGTNNGVYLNKIVDKNKTNATTTFPLSDGTVWTDNGNGTYTISGNITGSAANSPYNMEIRFDDPTSSNYKMKAYIMITVGGAASSADMGIMDSAPDYTYYPFNSGTVTMKLRMKNQDGTAHTTATYDTAGAGLDDGYEVRKVFDVTNKTNVAYTIGTVVNNGDGTYDVPINYSGAPTDNEIYLVEVRYEWDGAGAGNVRHGTNFAFEMNSTQAPTVPIGTPPSNPGCPECTPSGAPTINSGPTPSATDSGTHVDTPFSITTQYDQGGAATMDSCEYTTNGSFPGTAGTLTNITGTTWECTTTSATCSEAGNPLSINMRLTYDGGTTLDGVATARDCDSIAPSTTDDVTVGWRTTDQTVTLVPTDGGSGVASTDWCVDTVNTCTPGSTGDSFGTGISVNVTCTAGTACTQYVRYASTDNVGNAETTNSSTSQIDKSLPSTTDNVPVGWQTNDISVTLTPTDTGSGVASTVYCVDTVNTCTPATAYSVPFSVTCAAGTACTQYVRYSSTDNAGNVEATKSSTSQIDKSLPSTSDDVTAGWRATDQTVTLTPTDTGSGVASTLYCVDSVNSCAPVTSGVSVSVTCAAGTVCTQYVRYASTDNVGNAEATKSSTSQIDKSTPTDGSLTPTPGDTQIDLSWSGFSDTGSGLDPADSYKLVYNQGGTFPSANCTDGTEIPAVTTQTLYSHTGLTNGLTYYYRLCGIDAVGNISAGATASGVPNAGPQPPSVVSGPTPSATDTGTHVDSPFHLNTVFDDSGDAISGCEYTTNGSTWTAATVSGSGATTNCDADPTCTNAQGLTINMRATNINGTTTATSVSRTCDTVPPITTDDVTGWRNTDQSVTLTPVDTGSGVASTVYCVDAVDSCSPATSYAAPFNVTCTAGTACTQYVRYSSTDNLGIVETTKSSTSLIDKVLPVDGVALSAVPLDNEIALTWDAGSDADSGLAALNRYKVVRATGVTPPADCSGAAEYQGNNLGYNDTGVLNGTAYSYRVCVFDEAGNVSAGQTITETPAAPPPSTITSCSGCHAQPPIDATGGRGTPATAVVGSHSVTEHLGLTCTNCHIDNGTPASAYPQGLRHREGLIEVLATIHGQAGSSYSKGTSFDQIDTPTLGTCNATECHGTTSFVWGTDKASSDRCTICHGNEATATADGAAAEYKRAPGADGTGVDTAGQTGTVTSNVSDDPQVGAHQVHLNSQNSYGKNVPCLECHAVPATPSDAGHYDDALPADMTWGTLATTGSLTPNWTGTNCTSTYCHGNAMPLGSTGGANKSPAWSTDPTYLSGTPDLAADCAQCHEAPPAGVSPHSGSETIADCATCHIHFNIDGSLNDITQHIDGAIQASEDCWICHGDGSSKAYPPDAWWGTTKSTADGVGAHVVHLESTALIFTKEGAGTLVENWCDECHTVPVTAADAGHQDGAYPADISFGSSIEAVYNAVTPVFTPEPDNDPDTGVGGSCSVYCHGVTLADGLNTAPDWGDTITGCTACHGNPSASIPDHVVAGTCTDCHSHVGTGADHIDSSITFPNATCTSCHAQPPGGVSYPDTDKSHTAHFNQTVEAGQPIADCNSPACHVKPTLMDHADGTVVESCSTSICHNTLVATDPGSTPGPTWGTGTADCGWCHENPPTTTTAVAADHITAVPTTGCSSCHSHEGTASPATHIDGSITYPNATCTSCHGQPPNGASVPNTDGSHTAHFNQTVEGGQPISDCNSPACHVKPVAMNHADGATLQSCSTSICHNTLVATDPGSNSNPTWGTGTADCGWCHENPPSTTLSVSADHTGVPGTTGCSNCHSHEGTLNNVDHIDGAITFPNATCTSCHGQPPDGASVPNTDGSHQSHFNTLITPAITDCDSPACHVKPGASVFDHADGTTLQSCSTAACHDFAGFGDAPGAGTSPNPTWGTGNADCGWCHGNPPILGQSGSHDSSTDCSMCHAELNADDVSFADNTNHMDGTIQPGVGDCTGCHDTGGAGTTGPNTRDAVVTEFGLAWGHKKTGRGAVTNADCIVCHLEGNYTTQATSSYHNDGNIDLRDPDGAGETPITNIAGGAWTFTAFSTSYGAGSRTTSGHTAENVDNILTQKFCLACHDNNGATNTTARTAGGDATMPWGNVNLGGNYTTANGAADAGGLIDVKTQVNAGTSSSYHPMTAPRSAGYPTTALMIAPYDNFTRSAGTLADSVVLNCFDCHNSPTTLTTRTRVSHGSSAVNAVRGNATASAGDSNPNASTGSTLCFVCHSPTTSGQNSHKTGSAYSGGGKSPMDTFLEFGCNMCHASGYDTAVVRPIRAQDVHGYPNTVSGPTTHKVAFIRGNTPEDYVTSHNPQDIGGTTYTPDCTGMGGTICNGQRTKTYNPGGVY